MAPPDWPPQLQLTLRSGTVYYFSHYGLNSSEPHFFAIINADPLANKVLLMAVGSSRIAKVQERRRGLPPESLVVVDPSEYPDFTKPTIIDCNQVFELSREELVQKFKAKTLRYHRDLPQAVLEKIWRGVRASPRVDDNQKKLIPPDTGGGGAAS